MKRTYTCSSSIKHATEKKPKCNFKHLVADYQEQRDITNKQAPQIDYEKEPRRARTAHTRDMQRNTERDRERERYTAKTKNPKGYPATNTSHESHTDRPCTQESTKRKKEAPKTL